MSEYNYIYLIRHPFLREGYIGESCDPPRRMKEHLRDRKMSPKNDWFYNMKIERIKPQMEILERVHKSKIFQREAELIKTYIRDGWEIFNSTHLGIIIQ